MPGIFEALGVWLSTAIGGIVARVFLSLGMGVVTYTGISLLLDHLVQMIHSRLAGVPSDILQIMGIAGFDVFLSLILSAHTGMITFTMAATGARRISFLRDQESR